MPRHSVLMKRRLRWFGHVCRKDSDKLPRAVMVSEMRAGFRSVGWPLLRYVDRVKDDFKLCGVAVDGAEMLVRDRSRWRRRVQEGADAAEDHRPCAIGPYRL